MTGDLNINNLANETLSKTDMYFDLLIKFAIDFGPKVIGAILVLWIGLKIVNLVNKGVQKIMDKAKWDPMLESFISSLISIVLKILVLITAAGVIGIETSSFIAMLAAAGFAIGMALSGTLQNFAGGVMILLLKPFKIGDFVDVAGHSGSIVEIGIFNTTMLTGDRKRITIPNSNISDESMVNYSSEEVRRLDLKVGIGYSDDIDLAKETLKEIADEDKRIIHKDGYTICVDELGDNAVILKYRFFIKASDYWAVKGDVLEKIKKTFDKKGLNFPFPQREIHITKGDM